VKRRTNDVIVGFIALRRGVFQVIAGAETDTFAKVRLRVLVVSRRAMLVRIGEVVGSELVEIRGAIAQHGHGEILQ